MSSSSRPSTNVAFHWPSPSFPGYCRLLSIALFDELPWPPRPLMPSCGFGRHIRTLPPIEPPDPLDHSLDTIYPGLQLMFELHICDGPGMPPHVLSVQQSDGRQLPAAKDVRTFWGSLLLSVMYNLISRADTKTLECSVMASVDWVVDLHQKCFPLESCPLSHCLWFLGKSRDLGWLSECLIPIPSADPRLSSFLFSSFQQLNTSITLPPHSIQRT